MRILLAALCLLSACDPSPPPPAAPRQVSVRRPPPSPVPAPQAPIKIGMLDVMRTQGGHPGEPVARFVLLQTLFHNVTDKPITVEKVSYGLIVDDETVAENETNAVFTVSPGVRQIALTLAQGEVDAAFEKIDKARDRARLVGTMVVRVKGEEEPRKLEFDARGIGD